jgi:hypothetical protein
MKNMMFALFVVSISFADAETLTLSDPSSFQSYSQSGMTAALDSARMFNGVSTIKITKNSGQYAGLTFSSVDPISSVSYYQYDEFGTSSPFYNYIFLYDSPTSSKWLVWRDSGYNGTIGADGGENFFPYGSLTRKVGWQKVEAIMDSSYINFKLNDVLVARFASTNPIEKVAFDISGGGSNVSYNISPVTITTVPEPSALSLLAIGLGGLALVRRRRL